MRASKLAGLENDLRNSASLSSSLSGNSGCAGRGRAVVYDTDFDSLIQENGIPFLEENTVWGFVPVRQTPEHIVGRRHLLSENQLRSFLKATRQSYRIMIRRTDLEGVRIICRLSIYNLLDSTSG